MSPRIYEAPGGPVKYKFWIRSSRGTDRFELINLPDNYNENDIHYELKEWCSQFGAWHVSQNVVKYGFDLIEEA